MKRAALLVGGLLIGVLLVGCGGVELLALVPVGPRETTHTRVDGTRLDVVIGQRGLPVSNAAARAWVDRSARMVSDYAGGLPVDRLAVRVLVGVPGGVLFGQHWRGRRVSVLLGAEATPEDLAEDWVLPHELAHTLLPDLPRRHLWIREGLSTHLQTLLRARSGVFDERELWADWTRNLRRGVPGPGHRGLDRDRSRDRTYWGGALYWFLVDLETRERTRGRRSARDAVRGILAAGGSSRVRWPLRRVLQVGDHGAGVRVMSELYRRLGRTRGEVDLDARFAELGVIGEGDGVRFDDEAPLAHLRRSFAEQAVALPPMPVE